MLPKGPSVLKFLNPSISTKKGIKTEISPENIKISKISLGVCKSSFHIRITEKYNFLKRSSRLFPDLIFFNLTFSDSVITNIINLITGDRYFRPHFNLTFYLMRNGKVRIYGGISQNNNLLPFSREQAKPNPGTIYKKSTNWDLTSALFNVRNESTSFYSIYRYLKARIPRTSLFQKPFNSLLEEKLFFKQLLLSTDGITSKIDKAVSKDNDILVMHERYKLINGRKNEIEMENDGEIWKTRESGMLGFRRLAPDMSRIFFPNNTSLPQIFREGLLLSKNGHMETQDTGNHTHLLSKLGILSKAPEISGRKIQNLEDIAFLKTVELNELGPNSLILKSRRRQKSDMRILIVNKDSKVENGIPYDTFYTLKNSNLRYVNSYEGAAIHPVEMRDKGKATFGNGQDVVLRKPIMSHQKEIYEDIEENAPEYTSKENIRFLPEKNNSYAVSTSDINTIVNKVYRLLETKLLIEKERRGLR